MTSVVSRDDFILACPAELKKRIDDFFVFYSQKKKANAFSGPPETGKKFFKQDQGKFEKKNNMGSFKKPFDKKVSESEKLLTDFKGILSKLNENNQDAIWQEIQELHLEKQTTAAIEDDGWTVAGTSTKRTNQVDHSQEISNTLYQYSRNCSMYLTQYVDLVILIRKYKEIAVFANQYVDAVVADLDRPKGDNRAYNVLTHLICCELFGRGLMTKKKFLSSCILDVHAQIVKQLAEKVSTEESMEILLQNMNKCGSSIAKSEELSQLVADLKSWKDNKVFSGKLHFNLIDLSERMEKW